MSTIASISNSGVDATTLLQKLIAQQTGDSTNTASAASQKSSESPPEDFPSKLGEALQALGVSKDDATTIQDEIKSAIAAALQNQESDAASRDAVREAIEGTLEKHGLDPDTVRKQFESMFGKPGSAGGPGNGSPPSGPPPAPAEESTSSTSTEASTETPLTQLLSANNLDSSTLQLLQSLLPQVNTTV
jgi:hypothetical protein